MKNKPGIIAEIENFYSYKKILLVFLIEVFFFQILAWNTSGNINWIIGDYLWYSFIFLGLIEAISIARRRRKLTWESNFLHQIEMHRYHLLSGLELDLRTFDVEVKDYFMIDNVQIHSSELKRKLEKMKNHYHHSVLKIKAILDSINEDIDNLWNQDIYEQITQLTSPLETDIPIIMQSKNSFLFKVNNYNRSVTGYKDIIRSKEMTSFEEFKMNILPFLMSLIIAIQLGNITNRLLEALN